MTDKALAGIFFTMIIVVFLAAFSLMSFISYYEYIAHGEVSFPFYFDPCGTTFVILMGFGSIVNIANSYQVTKITRSPRCARSFYISLFYPILLYSYFIATFQEGFEPAFIYGFPIFMIGVILLPYVAFTVNQVSSAVQKNIRIINCRNCHYYFEVHRSDKVRKCPQCGILNYNYLTLLEKE